MIGRVRSQLNDLLFAPVGTRAMAEVDKEMTPLIRELVTLEQMNDLHPGAVQVFNWLVDPQRTVEEFNYVVGPLGTYISEQYNGHIIHLVKVAAEALAATNPVLTGLWEQAALFVIRLSNLFGPKMFGSVSDRLSEWVIRVSANFDLCPSAYLRIELMTLIPYLNVNANNRDRVFESLISACSSLDLKYLAECDQEQDGYVLLEAITRAIRMVTKEYLNQVDHTLVKNLKDLNAWMLSNILHDVTYQHRLKPSRYTEPIEVQALTALLRTTSEYAGLRLKKFRNNQRQHPGWLPALSNMLQLLIVDFPNTCQSPQLISETASCTMNVLELVLMVHVTGLPDPGKVLIRGLIGVENALQRYYQRNTFSGYASPLAIEIIRKYDGRLKELGDLLLNLDFWMFPMISDLVYNVYSDMIDC